MSRNKKILKLFLCLFISHTSIFYLGTYSGKGVPMIYWTLRLMVAIGFILFALQQVVIEPDFTPKDSDDELEDPWTPM